MLKIWIHFISHLKNIFTEYKIWWKFRYVAFLVSHSMSKRMYIHVYSSSSILFHLFIINNKFHSVYLNNIRLIQHWILESQVPPGFVFTTTPQQLSRIFLFIIIISCRFVKLSWIIIIILFMICKLYACKFLVQLCLGHYYIEYKMREWKTKRNKLNEKASLIIINFLLFSELFTVLCDVM